MTTFHDTIRTIALSLHHLYRTLLLPVVFLIAFTDQSSAQISFSLSGEPVGDSWDLAVVTPTVAPNADPQCFAVTLPDGLFRVSRVQAADTEGTMHWWQGALNDPVYCVDPNNPQPMYIGAREVIVDTGLMISVGQTLLPVTVHPPTYSFSPTTQTSSQTNQNPYLTGTRNKAFPYYLPGYFAVPYRRTSPNCVQLPDDNWYFWYKGGPPGGTTLYVNGVVHYLVDDSGYTFYVSLPGYQTVFDAYEMTQELTCHFSISYGEWPYPLEVSVDYQPFQIDSADTICPCGKGGAPINLTNGNTWVTEQDYSIPGIGGGLSLARTWNSLWRRMNPPFTVGMFGDSWISEWEEHLQASVAAIVLWNGNGSQWTFTWSGPDNAYVVSSPPDEKATLVANGNGGYVLRLKDGTRHVFNSGGQLVRIQDRNGNRRTLSWNGNRLNSVTDGAGRSLAFSYGGGGSGNLVSSVVFNGKTVAAYAYDDNSQLLKVDYPDHSGYNFQYAQSADPWMKGLLAQVQDADGKLLESHTYDVHRRGLTSGRANVDGTGPVEGITVGYDWFNRANVLTNSLADTSSLTYNTIARRDFVSGANGVGCSTCGYQGMNWFSRDELGRVTSYYGPTSSPSDPLHPVTYGYDSRNNVTLVWQTLHDTRPVGAPIHLGTGAAAITPADDTQDIQTYTYKYNNFAEVTKQTDPLGNVTTNTYDNNGNLLSTLAPDGGVTSYTYDAQGNATSATDARGNTTLMTYTAAGLLETVTDAQGNVMRYEYDGEANRTAVVDALGNRTAFTYDVRNRLTGTLYPDGTIEAITYDTRGRKTSYTTHGVTTTYAYDDADRLIAVTDPNGTTRYTYDTEDEITSITDPLNHTTAYVWGAPSNDSSRRVLQTIFPSGASETYSYDDAGRVIQTTLRDGSAVYASYDTFGRITQKSFADSTGAPGGAFTYTYDIANHLTDVTDPAGTYSYKYDDMGRTVKSTTVYSAVPSRTFTLRYDYDANSNRTQMTMPGSETVGYTYDNLNHLTAITDSEAGSFAFAYDALGRRTTVTRPNGISSTYSYDAGSKLLSLVHQGASLLDGVQYGYDGRGNRIQRTDLRTQTVDQYTYDVTNQLARVDEATPATALAVKERFLYDAVGNRLGAARATNTYDASNELLSTSNASYTYDANGNLSSVSGTTPASYTWNPLGQMVASSDGTTFTYDYLGRRVSKGATFYVYDGADSVLQVNADGTGAGRFVHGPGTDEHLAVRRGGVWYYYEQDGLGSVTSLTDAAGNIAAAYSYMAFGKSKRELGTLNQPYRYTGREWDNETGLYYYRARYYDPTVGRFISEDPLSSLSGNFNLYRYASNGPIGAIDPDGLDTIVMVFWNNRQHTGVLGEHTAVFVTNTGHPILYDPSGDSRINGYHPTNDIFQDEDADLGQFLNAHGSQNPDTFPEVFDFDTTPEQEKEIAKRIERLGHPGSFNCADAVSSVLNGIGPFKDLGHYYRPSALAKELRELEIPVIPRIALRRLKPNLSPPQ